MSMENENQRLIEKFNQPLEYYQKRKIVFWLDPNGEFSNSIGDLDLPNVRTLILTGTNNFIAKKTIEKDDILSDFLVYCPFNYENIKDNWLLDIQLYSEEFRADLVSSLCEELSIEPSVSLRNIIQKNMKFFNNIERRRKLKSFGNQYSKTFALEIDLLSVLCGLKVGNFDRVIQTIFIDSLDVDDNRILAEIAKFSDLEGFWELVKRTYGFEPSGDNPLMKLAGYLFINATSKTMNIRNNPNLQKYINGTYVGFCYSLVNSWLHDGENDHALFEISRAVEEWFQLPQLFESYDVDELALSETFPCIDEIILKKLFASTINATVKSADIIKTVEMRRTSKWYHCASRYFTALHQVALMYDFQSSHIEGFHITEYEKLWSLYCADYYQMDTLYRKYFLSYNEALKEGNDELDDLLKSTAVDVENLYKNWFLSNLSMQWTKDVKEPIENDSRLRKLKIQEEFFSQNCSEILFNNGRVFVIISDALRFEVAKELNDILSSETGGKSTIASMQGIFPTITRCGMAALLPHHKLTVDENMKVYVDGASVDSIESRGKVLQKQYPESVAIKYKDFNSMKNSERQDYIRGKKVVYIYHDYIDAIGDKLTTEEQVFNACEGTIEELKQLVKILTNLSATNIFITADHGFLYTNNPLLETDKAEKALIQGEIIEYSRRYAIIKNTATAEHMIRIPLSHFEGSKDVGITPYENIRLKMQGGGANYVHGGISLQEMVIPLISYKNLKSDSKHFVAIEKTKIALLSQIHKISNSLFSLEFFQTEAVKDKMQANKILAYFADEKGLVISDKKLIIADNVSSDINERKLKLNFVLKNQTYKKSEKYFLVLEEQNDKLNYIYEKHEFEINILFSSDFDL